MILNEFDKSKDAILNPTNIQSEIPNFPEIGITCFTNELIEKLLNRFDEKIISKIYNANGEVPVYKINYNGVDIAIFMSRVGAAACTVSYEEVLAMGLEKLIMFGTCGALDKNIEDLTILIPTAAIRDEGTSYHYMQESDEISVNEKYIDDFKNILNENNYPYLVGKVWTTDAPYRETRNQVSKRKKQGCIAVDMECSAMSAVSKFRNKEFFEFFYAADNLDNIKWEERSLGNHAKLDEKEKIINMALDFAYRISNK